VEAAGGEVAREAVKVRRTSEHVTVPTITHSLPRGFLQLCCKLQCRFLSLSSTRVVVPGGW
jgi:hypothetical protein